MFKTLRQQVILGIVGCLGFFWLLFFFWSRVQERHFVEERLRHQALGIYHYIVLSREWIAKHNGVYVREKGGYRLLTPSAFTSRLADYSKDALPYSIKIAADDARLPQHVPDPFEARAIELMKAGRVKELWRMEKKAGHARFRYAAPLRFVEDCAGCHQKNRKPLGVVGCISITLPADSILRRLQLREREHLVLFGITLFLAVSVLWIMLRRLVILPLRELDRVSRAVERGDFGVEARIAPSAEWERVVESFNQMVKALASQQQRLEQEVEKAVQELKTAYRELQKASDARSTFFANVTHDLKTPITAIKGAIDLIEKKQGEDISNYIEIIRRNTAKLLKMVQNLIACTKMESGALEFRREEVDLTEVVESCVVMLQPLAWERRVRLRYEMGDEAVMVEADPVLLEQAISNVMANAIRYSPEGEEVTISLEPGGEGDIILTVEDRGPGIPSHQRERVFDKFYRGPQAASGEGMGLGLCIARSVVEAHGGSIWIEDAPAGGTRMRMRLPLIRQGGPGRAAEGRAHDAP